MTASRPVEVPEQVRALRLALEGLATALAGGDAAAVLGQERVLQAALGTVPASVRAGDRAAVLVELTAARTALTRCRALGTANAELTRITLEVLGRTGAYNRHGAGPTGGSRGRDLHARV